MLLFTFLFYFNVISFYKNLNIIKFLIVFSFYTLHTSITKFIAFISYCCFYFERSSNVLEREKFLREHRILSLPSSHILKNLEFYTFGFSSTFLVTSHHCLNGLISYSKSFTQIIKINTFAT